RAAFPHPFRVARIETPSSVRPARVERVTRGDGVLPAAAHRLLIHRRGRTETPRLAVARSHRISGVGSVSDMEVGKTPGARNRRSDGGAEIRRGLLRPAWDGDDSKSGELRALHPRRRRAGGVSPQ